MRTHSFRSLPLATVIVALSTLALPKPSFAGVFVSITVAPPVLPVYVQPICPAEGYMWTPGYWAYGVDGYYWVPGTWILAPRPGFLWTPGYWGFGGGYYLWHVGYWGPRVGFYGGVNYGFGYGGVGYGGGMWVGGRFSYNTAVTNVNTTNVHNTYVNNTVVNNTSVNRTSFNGPNGVTAQPTVAERAASREQHVAPTAVQTSHEHSASMNRSQLASVNHGNPGASHPANARPASRPPANHPNPRPEGGQKEHRPER
jgi:hypothetical protein